MFEGGQALRYIPLIILAAMAVTACSSSPMSWRLKNADFWQRADIRTATYMGDVEAQKLLNRDIARCTVDVKEQERLAVLHNSIPAEGRGVDPRSPDGYMAGWDTPERDGYLHAEHLPYHNFETCMMYRGWERVSTVPPDVAQRSRNAWLDHVAPPAKPRAPATGSVKAESGGNTQGYND